MLVLHRENVEILRLGQDTDSEREPSEILFPCHRLVAGTNMVIVPPKTTDEHPHRYGSQSGFRIGSIRKQRSESEEDFATRRKVWQESAVKHTLSIVDQGNIDENGGEMPRKVVCDRNGLNLANGDIVLPKKSQTQSHSDVLLVTKFDPMVEGRPPENGLIFVRNEMSNSKPCTVISPEKVITLIERQNQISKLDVKEENVVYCWSVMAPLPEKRKEFDDKIANFVTEAGFKGYVLGL